MDLTRRNFVKGGLAASALAALAACKNDAAAGGSEGAEGGILSYYINNPVAIDPYDLEEDQGMMVGYLASSAVSLLNFLSTAEGVQSFTVWGMGHFGNVSLQQMPAYAAVVLLGLVGAFLLMKPLNALLLGERYAENLGIPVRRVRHLLLAVTGLLTAVTTAFCGPVLFLDLAVPHVARMLLGTANHRVLLPLTALTGGAVALLCNLL